MKAVEIGEGMVLRDEKGDIVYTVLGVKRVGELVDALVEFAVDGGRDWRTWDAGMDVPLAYPGKGMPS